MLLHVHTQLQRSCPLCRVEGSPAAAWVSCACGARVHEGCARELRVRTCPVFGCEGPLLDSLELLRGAARFQAPEADAPAKQHPRVYLRSSYRPDTSPLSTLEFGVTLLFGALTLGGVPALQVLLLEERCLYARWVMESQHRLQTPNEAALVSTLTLVGGMLVVGVVGVLSVRWLRRRRGATRRARLSNGQVGFLVWAPTALVTLLPLLIAGLSQFLKALTG